MSADESVVVNDEGTSRRRWPGLRLVCIAVYVMAFVGGIALWGFPASRDRVLVWVIVGLVILVAGRPHGLARLVVGFLPVIVFLFAYDLLRGAADEFSTHVYELPQLRVDEWLFAGTAPTVTLQRAFWTPGHPHVWDYVAIIVYLTYFVV